jgi:hypothetical protein
VLWVRSYVWTDIVLYKRVAAVQRQPGSQLAPGYVRFDRVCVASSKNGHLVAYSVTNLIARGVSGWHRNRILNRTNPYSMMGDGPHKSFLGFALIFTPQPCTELIVPYWAVVAAGLLPGMCAAQVLRKLKHEPAVCRVCGYDLRASKDRCPECGKPIGPNAVPAEKSRISNYPTIGPRS